MKLIKDLLTQNDGMTYCPVRFFGSIGFISFIMMAFYELYRHCHDFQLLELSGGISMILGIFAGGVTMKSKSEQSSSN